MTRLAAALIVIALSALAQERTWQDVHKESVRLYSEGRLEEAASAMAEAGRLAETSGTSPKERAKIEAALAQMLHLVDRAEDAETHMRRAVELLASAVPALDPSLADARIALAGLEAENGRLDQAAFDACTALEAVQGLSPALEAQCLLRLALIFFKRRAYMPAMSMMKLAIARVREASLETSPHALRVGLAVTSLAMEIGEYGIADRMLAETHQIMQTARPNPAVAMDFGRLVTDLRIRQRRLAEAEKIAQETLDLNVSVSGSIPNEVAALTTSLARVALEQNDLKRAAECIERAELALRRPGYDSRSKLGTLLDTRAELRRRQGDRKAARADLEEALGLRARDGEHGLGAARTLLALARVESEDGAHPLAIAYAERATRIYLREIGPSAPEGADACAAYARIRAKALEAGLRESDAPVLKGVRLDEALEADAAAADAKVRQLLQEGRDLYSRRDLAGALALYDKAAAIRPGEPTVHGQRAFALFRMNRTEEAIAALDAAIQWSIQPDPKTYELRAMLQIKLERYDRAIVDTTCAVLLGDGAPDALHFRGTARLMRRESELALRSLDACVAARPESAWPRFWRGVALADLDRTDEAAEALRTAAESSDIQARAWARLAAIERRRGDLEKALTEANRAIEAGAEGLEGFGVRGFIRLDRGDWKAALADVEAWAGDEPPSLYGRILQWLCRARLGERKAGDAALGGAIDGEKEREDLQAVARAILGEGPAPATDEPVPPDRKQREQACEAHFLLGAWREIEGDPAGARAHYERAIAMGCLSVLEHQSAKWALGRLDAAK